MTSQESQVETSQQPAEEKTGLRIPLRWEMASYGVLLAVAAAMRLWDLGSRAMHHDESLHAFYSWNLSNGGGYQHNPMMHGPFQFHGNALIFFLFGDSDYTARLLYALFGIALVGMPYLLRSRLGQIGALIVAGLLAFSPAMLYFSRFARNDILMAVWTLGLVITIWRYIDERKARYLYVAAALLAFAFTTKETAYITVGILGSFLFLMAAPEVFSWLRGRLKLSQLSAPATLLLIFVTLTLPQWAAAVSLLQGPLGITLAISDPAVGPIGTPSGGGLLIAALVVLFLLWISAYLGFNWNWKVWLGCAAIFYAIWALLYTTFFTNLIGVGSGMWQSLGYWVVQQDIQRGGQPWYYYFVITPVYEFLPFLFAIGASIYYARKGDLFSRFLVYWAALTFFLYTMAGEKMPWLLVNITLPLIILSGKALGDVIRAVQWRRLTAGGGFLLVPGAPLFAVLLWQLAFFELDTGKVLSYLSLLAIVAVVLGVLAGVIYIARRTAVRSVAAFSGLALAGVLFVLTVRAGWQASYKNGDVPVEMMVYTQTSPDIPRIVQEIEQTAKATGKGAALPVTVDATDGFSWPWAWYLRNYTRAGYPCYSGEPGCISLSTTPDASVLLINARNEPGAGSVLSEGFSEGVRIKHRWWFPEGYRDVTPGKIWSALRDREQWRKFADYFLYRKLDTELGSVDAYVYFSDDLPDSGSFTP